MKGKPLLKPLKVTLCTLPFSARDSGHRGVSSTSIVQHALQALSRFGVRLAERLHGRCCLLDLLKGLFGPSLELTIIRFS